MLDGAAVAQVTVSVVGNTTLALETMLLWDGEAKPPMSTNNHLVPSSNLGQAARTLIYN